MTVRPPFGRLLLAIAFVGASSLAGCVRAGPPSGPVGPPSDLPPPSTEREAAGGERTGPPSERAPAPDPGGTDRDARAPLGDVFPDASVIAELPPLRLPELDEVRALWVVRTALSHPDSARAAVRRADEAGFNTIFVQVRGRGDAYYQSRWEPRADFLGGQPPGYDPLEVILREARPRGISVHAWVNAHVVASARMPPSQPSHLAVERPDLLAVPRALSRELFGVNPWSPEYFETLRAWTLDHETEIEGIYSSPAHPEVSIHLHRVVTDLVGRYDLDGLHLDYIRYPSADFDYSRGSLEEFRRWIRARAGEPDAGAPSSGSIGRAEGRWTGDPLAYVEAFPGYWDDFRRERVTGLMRGLFVAAREVRPDLVISAAVFAGADDAIHARYQAWEEWLRLGIVDAVAPMAYTSSDEVFLRQIDRAVAVAGGRRVWAGLGIYQNTFEGAVAKGRAARAAGVGGMVLFSYDWAVSPDGVRAGGGPYLTRFSRELWGLR